VRIGVVGAGRVGTAFALLLARSGHRIVGVSGREATRVRATEHLPGVAVIDASAVVGEAELVLVTVPDDAIAGVVQGLAEGDVRGRWFAHASGALDLAPLEPLVEAGARRFAIHPLMTAPSVERAIADIPGSTAAVTADDEEGHRLGEAIARDLGATPFRLEGSLRPLYHAAAVLASNDLVALAAIAEELFARAGVPDPGAALGPLQRATLDNVVALGPGAALTGPAVRGDAGTVARNLAALAEHAPEAVAAYVVLSRAAVDLAARAERLDAEGRRRVEEALERWS
jgi:predicted short-subunit dehydrogenase-like oxidoreductase (DUF2520 family)